ncbi:Sec34-domain-containing protein [Coprinellus micaceus]|uniref:Conserved oligomeric Golgi complex subunit 3 n=1 Tax=Coprinellus micaceus TaxID=71717 RepID=A0A4Y7T1S0_COPMI|nr:Sec34-domain-containing protein [Coprinellus micaceus]
MSSTSRGTRRSQAPSSLSVPQSSFRASPALSVEEWEAKAPLGDLEIRSVNAIKIASEKVPFPLKFTREDEDDEDDESEASSRSATPSTPGNRPNKPTSLHPRQPIHTTQQLYDWFAVIDRSVAHSQESHFRAYVASVSEYLDVCDALLARVSEVEVEVETMGECWWSVEEGGRSLKEACERVLLERDQLLQLTDAIGGYLEYFTELESATRMLNHPGEDLLFSPDFLSTVSKIDTCIEFLRARRHFKESEVYLLRFHQCLVRSMTLVKMNFVNSLRTLTADTAKKLGDKERDTEPDCSHAPTVKPLLGEMERRARKYPDELGSLLAECVSAYFSVRKALLVPKVLEEIRGLDPARSELVELTRTGCSYLKQLCTDEFNLYRKFFNTAEDQLYQYLESLCDLLYDDLRPRILHEARLTALCEVCTVLQALMTPRMTPITTTTDDDEDSFSDELNIDFDHPGREKSKDFVGKRLHTQHLLQMVLQDAQTRLFFKAQAVVQSEVRWYVPKGEDIAWPDVILNAKKRRNVDATKPRGPTEMREKESVSRIFENGGSEGLGEIMKKQETWYPTVRKMVWVLEQLHDFVKPAIFEDIAQEAALLCRQSLFSAADLIKARPPPSVPLDGSLFLVRHLLILKEVARRVGLSTSGTVDSGVQSGKGTLTTMLNRTTAILPEGLFASLGVPRADENLRDVKHGLDDDLRRACEEVISSCVDPLCEPLDEWVMKVRTFSQSSSKQPSGSHRHHASPSTAATPAGNIAAITSPAKVNELYEEFRLKTERDLRANAARVRLYLGEQPNTQEVAETLEGQGEGSSTPRSPHPASLSNSNSSSSNSNRNGGGGGGRTSRVLIEHIRERVWEGYRGFLESAKEVALAVCG